MGHLKITIFEMTTTGRLMQEFSSKVGPWIKQSSPISIIYLSFILFPQHDIPNAITFSYLHVFIQNILYTCWRQVFWIFLLQSYASIFCVIPTLEFVRPSGRNIPQGEWQFTVLHTTDKHFLRVYTYQLTILNTNSNN